MKSRLLSVFTEQEPESMVSGALLSGWHLLMLKKQASVTALGCLLSVSEVRKKDEC